MAAADDRQDEWPHPARFPISSKESRAAARAFLEQQDKVDFQIIVDIPGSAEMPERRYRCVSDGKIIEVVYPKWNGASE